MLREKRVILAILFLCSLGSVFIVPVYADTPVPCEYYGEVTILGIPAPTGSTLAAYLNGQERGRITTHAPGQYGSTCIFGKRLKVQPTEEEYTGDAILLIEFYVNGLKADQTSVFHPGAIQSLDLTVSRVPTPEPTPFEEPEPVVALNATPRCGYAPLLVAFADLTSPGAESWLWDFGDGYLSHEQHPSHLYRHTGNYTVNLTVCTVSGCSGLQVPDYIQVIKGTMYVFPGQTNLPKDPDNDGFYEDLNGDGVIRMDDLFLFFSYREWIGENMAENPFDYNLNGRLDMNDIFSLFIEL